MANAMTSPNAHWGTQFSVLARQMDAVLAACPSIALLACSTVNPRHPIPPDHKELVAPEAERGQGGAPKGRTAAVDRLRAIVRTLAFAAKTTALVAYVQFRFSHLAHARIRNKASVLIKSWFFDVPADDRSDFYFKNILELLHRRGIDALLLGGRSGHGSVVRMAQGLLRPGMRTVPEEVLVPWWAPLATVLRQIATSASLARLAHRSDSPRFRAVALRASRECLKPETCAHALYYYSTKRAMEIWRPKAYVTLYEGQPWEKAAWLAVKAVDPECTLIGYQHTVVMPHALGLLRPCRDGWAIGAPDVVLGSGPGPVSLLQQGHQGIGTRFVVFGSFRADAAIRERPPETQRIARRVVLVAPEGIMEEAVLLFNRAAQAASMLPDYRFIFRCHPVLPFQRVRPYLDFDVEALANVEVSDRKNIQDDFSRSSCLFYRGSSVVFYAVLAGLKPFYLDEKGTPHVDSIFALQGWRESVRSPGELADALRHYANRAAIIADDEWRSAKDFVNDYIVPVSENSINAVSDLLAKG